MSLNNHQVMFYFCYGYINPGMNKVGSYIQDFWPTILMSENFQLRFLK